MEKGDKVIYLKELKGLPKDSIGIIETINNEFVLVSYPQYEPVDKNGNYVYGNFVYGHSAKIEELKLI